MNIQTLAAKVAQYQEQYYNGLPTIADTEFDTLYNTLESIAPLHEVVQSPGADKIVFEKRTHMIAMGSLYKAKSETDLAKWVAKHSGECVLQYKLDGVGLELQYEDGVLVAAVTRGDGITGDDILNNACKMKGVQSRIRAHSQVIGKLAVRGEVIMRHEIQDKHFSEMMNCRNGACGVMKRHDGSGCEHLEFVAYNMEYEHNDTLTEKQKIETLKMFGFITVHTETAEFGVQPILDFLNKADAARETIGYDIDGIVIKSMYTAHDTGSARPKDQTAYKFTSVGVDTVIEGVEWSRNGGTYSPVAILKPVYIDGAVVKRASLYNMRQITAMGLKIGSKVTVIKAGNVIPKITANVATDETMELIIPPVICYLCCGKLKITDTKVCCENEGCNNK